MNLIISKTLKNTFRNFMVTDSLEKAKDMKGIETVIINSFVEKEFNAGIYISNLRENGIETFIYINSSPSTTIRLIISGLKGYFFNDEFYFEDEEELLALIDDIKDNSFNLASNEETSLASPAITVVSDFIEAFVRGDKVIKAPLYLERVKDAIIELENITHQQELQITAMGNSAIEIFKKASEIIKGMDMQRQLIERQLAELENTEKNNLANARSMMSNSVTYFPPYSHMGNAKILLFREYSPARYLTTFAIAYTRYLKYVTNKRVKLVFVIQRGNQLIRKYSDFMNITQESCSIESLYDGEFIVTNAPKKEIMKKLCDRSGLDYVIVVDRMYGTSDICTGRGIYRVNVASSRGDVARYNLKPEETIFSVTSQQKQLFAIPTIKQFPLNQDARMAVYMQVFREKFEALDKFFGIS